MKILRFFRFWKFLRFLKFWYFLIFWNLSDFWKFYFFRLLKFLKYLRFFWFLKKLYFQIFENFDILIFENFESFEIFWKFDIFQILKFSDFFGLKKKWGKFSILLLVFLSTPFRYQMFIFRFSIFDFSKNSNPTFRFSWHIFVTQTRTHPTFSIYNYKIFFNKIYYNMHLIHTYQYPSFHLTGSTKTSAMSLYYMQTNIQMMLTVLV